MVLLNTQGIPPRNLLISDALISQKSSWKSEIKSEITCIYNKMHIMHSSLSLCLIPHYIASLLLCLAT